MSVGSKLTFAHRAFTHREAERKLNCSKMMISASDVECDVEETHDREMAAI